MGVEKQYYDAAFLDKQVKYYSGLPEKQRRHFLAMEFERLGRGSKRYISRVFGCARQTIDKGLAELSAHDHVGHYGRQRAAGGGRKKKKLPNPI